MTSVPWPEARALAHRVPALPAVDLPLGEAAGAVLAADLVARCDLPPEETSAMDGWAVAGPGPWLVVGRSLAGGADVPAVRSGEAVLITTGAAVPPGATGILRWERALRGAAGEPLVSVTDDRPVDLSDVRPRGEEAKTGEVLVPAGFAASPAVVGLAAAVGHDTLLVHRRPRVAVLVLGNELLDDGVPRDGRVRDSLGVQLPSWIAAGGGDVSAVLRVFDDAPATTQRLDEALTGADVVVTTGGSALGAADHLRGALADVGGRLVVDTVAVRPGRPMLLAEVPGRGYVVGLPGNPLAAVAGLVTLLQPLLAGLRGADLPSAAPVVTAESFPAPGRGAHALVPVRLDSSGARPTGHATAAMLRGLALSEGLLLVPPSGLPLRAPAPLHPTRW